MPFTLTKEHVHSLVDPTAEGDWTKFLDAIDPAVHWIVVDPIFDPESLAGTYVRLPYPAVSALHTHTNIYIYIYIKKEKTIL